MKTFKEYISEAFHGKYLVYLEKNGKQIKKHIRISKNSKEEADKEAERYAKSLGDVESTGYKYVKHVYRGEA